MWQQWINGILGLWLIVSAFVGFEASAMVGNLVIVGIIVAILGFWGAASGKRKHHTMGGSQPPQSM